MNLVVLAISFRPLLPDLSTFPANNIILCRECDIALIVMR